MKPKNEFKSRIRKVQKHIRALREIAPSDDQRQALDEMENKANWLGDTRQAYFDEELDHGTPHDLGQRRDPRSVAN